MNSAQAKENVISLTDRKVADMEQRAENIIAAKEKQTETELLIQLGFMVSCCLEIVQELLERRT